VTNSNLGHISHCYRDTASFPLPWCIMTLLGRPRSLTYMSFESQYATSYKWSIAT